MNSMMSAAVAASIATILANTLPGAAQQERFTDHGVPVPLAECRGTYAVQDGNGHNLVIATSLDQSPRGWILITDIDSGESEQVYVPEGIPNSPPYGSLMASTGKFYTSQGGILLEFDPTSRQWTFHGRAGGTSAILTIAEAPDGTIWTGGVYQANLASFDPNTRELTYHGSMDAQKYLSYLGFDDAGWVYCGIGTARCNLIAYNPQTGEKRQLVPEERRKVESGRVWRGVDGKLYGVAPLEGGTEYYSLANGEKTLLDSTQPPVQAPSVAQLPDGRVLKTFDMLDKYMEVYDPKTGLLKHITFDYESEGARLDVIHAGPDGKIYGDSSHPSRFISYDPRTDELRFYPGAIEFSGMATQGKYVFGGMYTGGALHVFDTSKPWNWVPEPQKIRDGIPAAELLKLARTDSGRLEYREDRDALLWIADEYDSRTHFTLTAPEAGQYYLYASYYCAPGYTFLQFYRGDEKITEQLDCRRALLALAPVLTAGPFELEAGEHVFSLRNVKGRHAEHPHLCLKSLLLTQRPPEDVLPEPPGRNPFIAIDNSRPDINVPDGAFAHPDGEHIIISGLPGYGRVGGGMSIYNMTTGEALKLTHEDLIEYHSTMVMQALPNGDIIAGTTVKGTHGGSAVEKDAVIWVLDWQTKQVRWKTSPVSDMRAITSMVTGSDGMLYCVGAVGEDSLLFVFDPETKQVLHQQSMTDYGGASLALGPDGLIYGVGGKAIVRITPGEYSIEKLADTPGGSGGIAILDGRIYFKIGTHLWSYTIG